MLDATLHDWARGDLIWTQEFLGWPGDGKASTHNNIYLGAGLRAGRFPGEGAINSLQHAWLCRESMDGGARLSSGA